MRQLICAYVINLAADLTVSRVNVVKVIVSERKFPVFVLFCFPSVVTLNGFFNDQKIKQ